MYMYVHVHAPEAKMFADISRYLLAASRAVVSSDCVTCRRCCSALVELRQHETRQKCLKQWQVPDEIRTAPDRSEKPRDRLQKLLGVSVGARNYSACGGLVPYCPGSLLMV